MNRAACKSLEAYPSYPATEFSAAKHTGNWSNNNSQKAHQDQSMNRAACKSLGAYPSFPATESSAAKHTSNNSQKAQGQAPVPQRETQAPSSWFFASKPKPMHTVDASPKPQAPKPQAKPQAPKPQAPKPQAPKTQAPKPKPLTASEAYRLVISTHTYMV